ncbi:MAG: chromosomal replication initiator protein DnaA, partial [Clostridia bacterium]|nr:chromosomal replication initiator protein DnaA [Clostridia bacterium]
MQNIKENWNNALITIANDVTTVTFDLWVKTLEPLTIKDDCLILLASSETAKKRCYELCANQLNLAIADNFENVQSYKIISPDEKDDFSPAPSEKENIIVKNNLAFDNSPKFNPKYTFDSFVVGKSNEFVYAAGRAVAENPGKRFNPLFIYGGVGLGKTHIMHAIGNYLRQNSPELNVLYVTCEKFTNDYIDSLRGGKNNSISSFREKYRNVDVLMVDDIQFISNKTETQEEFFHTFNDLYQNNKQIVIASDRHPREIPTLTDRILTRLLSGLTQDVQSPDFETRVAILKRKALEENYRVEENVYSYLAEKINTNIRELEGCLAKVHFYAGIHCKHFASLEDAELALQDEVTEKEIISADDVINAVCKYYNVDRSDLTGK